jgi:hypothetical protein
VKELYTEIEINASPERVWDVLTDFGRFGEWNPFIKSVEGKPAAGSRLRIRIQPPGGREMTFRPKILRCEPGQELRWLGRKLVRGVFEGQHTFKIEPIDAKHVRFIQRERFKGLLVPFVSRSLDSETKRGFNEMNRALKARAEAV